MSTYLSLTLVKREVENSIGKTPFSKTFSQMMKLRNPENPLILKILILTIAHCFRVIRSAPSQKFCISEQDTALTFH